MYAVIPQIEIVLRILSVQGQVVLRLLERIFNDGTWHAQATIVTHQEGVDETQCEDMTNNEFGVKYRARRNNMVG